MRRTRKLQSQLAIFPNTLNIELLSHVRRQRKGTYIKFRHLAHRCAKNTQQLNYRITLAISREMLQPILRYLIEGRRNISCGALIARNYPFAYYFVKCGFIDGNSNGKALSESQNTADSIPSVDKREPKGYTCTLNNSRYCGKLMILFKKGHLEKVIWLNINSQIRTVSIQT